MMATPGDKKRLLNGFATVAKMLREAQASLKHDHFDEGLRNHLFQVLVVVEDDVANLKEQLKQAIIERDG